jgi:hypothetical protein
MFFMKRMTKHLLSAVAVAIFIIAAIASSTGKNVTVSVQQGLIPPEFNPTSDTLLVLNNTISGIGVGKTIRSAFKDYKGPYKIISSKQERNFDTSVYKYTLYMSHNASNFTKADGRPGPGTVSAVFERRSDRKEFRSVGVPDWGKLVKNYVKTLNGMLR